MSEIQKGKSFRSLRQLIEFRKSQPALRQGLTKTLWLDHREGQQDDGVFVFARYLPDQPEKTVVVAFNLSSKTHELKVDLIGQQQEAIVPKGKRLKRLPFMGLPSQKAMVTWGEDAEAELSIAAETVSLWIVE